MLHRTRILIAEDNSDLRLLLESELTLRGYDVQSFPDPISAMMSLLEEGTVDVVISDFEMREASGIDFYKALRESQFTMPFILMSGNTEIRTSEVKSLGIAEFIEKPFSVSQIDTVIKDLLRENRETILQVI